MVADRVYTETAQRARAALAGVQSAPGVAKPDPILLADNVRKNFGGVVAVDVDHVEVQRGSITALIGPNGAGKTTLLNRLQDNNINNEIVFVKEPVDVWETFKDSNDETML